jgi:ribosomal protein S27E
MVSQMGDTGCVHEESSSSSQGNVVRIACPCGQEFHFDASSMEIHCPACARAYSGGFNIEAELMSIRSGMVLEIVRGGGRGENPEEVIDKILKEKYTPEKLASCFWSIIKSEPSVFLME